MSPPWALVDFRWALVGQWAPLGTCGPPWALVGPPWPSWARLYCPLWYMCIYIYIWKEYMYIYIYIYIYVYVLCNIMYNIHEYIYVYIYMNIWCLIEAFQVSKRLKSVCFWTVASRYENVSQHIGQTYKFCEGWSQNLASDRISCRNSPGHRPRAC